MKTLRKVLFWVHLVAGIGAGGVIAITAFTGAMMSFEKQVIAWAERDLRRVQVPSRSTARLPVDEILEAVREDFPEARPMGLTIASDPMEPVVVMLGRNQVVYANPYTGELRAQGTPRLRAFFQLMLRWHRWLGTGAPANEGARPAGGGERRAPGGARQVASTVVGISSVVFFGLALTGLVLWWPKSWNVRALRAGALPNFRLRGRARDWNWHNAVGFWVSPLILVMGFTGVVMAFRGFGNLVYGAQSGGPGGGGPASTNAVAIIVPADGTKPLGPGALIAIAQEAVPGWNSITLRMGNGRERGGRGGREARGPQPVSLMVRGVDQVWPLPVQLQVDPFTGAVLKREEPGDAGIRKTLRQLNRTLHTGEAGGIPGQAMALTGCIGGLVLVYTGFALTWRRMRLLSQRRSRRQEASGR